MAVKLFSPEESGPDATTVRGVVDLYLQQSARGKCHRAHQDRAHVLDVFCAEHGGTLIERAKPFHLRIWVDAQEQLGDWSRKRWCATIQAAMNWGVKMGMIDRNPFHGVSYRSGKRGRSATEDEYQAMLRHATDANFRRVLIFLRFTGARPSEMASATWAALDVDRGTITLHEHKTEHSRRDGKPRVIVLHPTVIKLLTLIRKEGCTEGAIFRNRRGKAWTRNALVLRIQRLRKRAELPKDCKLYGLRHAFASRAVLAGVELKILAELMGHTSTRMTEHYTHIEGATKEMRGAIGKIFGGGTTAS